VPTRSTALGRAVAEFTVVVLSILVAFGLDAWWDGRREAAQEQVLLAGLQGDFEANLQQLNAREETQELILRATDVLPAGPVTPRGSDLPPDSVARLLGVIAFNPTFDPTDGTLGALWATGGLGVIRLDSLRVELARWPGQVANYKEAESDVDRLTHVVLREQLARLIAYPRGSSGRAPFQELESSWPVTAEAVAALSSVEVESVLLDLRVHREMLLGFGDPVRSHILRILELIAASQT